MPFTPRLDTLEDQRCIREQIIGKFSPCCVDPVQSWWLIRSILETAERMEPLEDAPDGEGWVYLVAHFMESWGVIEHGISMHCPILTDNGKLLIAFLRQYGHYPDVWPDWVFGRTRTPV